MPFTYYIPPSPLTEKTKKKKKQQQKAEKDVIMGGILGVIIPSATVDEDDPATKDYLIKPSSVTIALGTSKWPLLLKSYDCRNVRAGHYTPLLSGHSPLKRPLQEYIQWRCATSPPQVKIAGQNLNANKVLDDFPQTGHKNKPMAWHPMTSAAPASLCVEVYCSHFIQNSGATSHILREEITMVVLELFPCLIQISFAVACYCATSSSSSRCYNPANRGERNATFSSCCYNSSRQKKGVH